MSQHKLIINPFHPYEDVWFQNNALDNSSGRLIKLKDHFSFIFHFFLVRSTYLAVAL